MVAFLIPLQSDGADGKPVTVTKNNIDAILASDELVLIDFWAAWCGPCLQIAPSVAELAQEYDGKVVVGKLNIDQQRELKRKYRIRAIPTLKIFKNGKIVDEIVGAASKDRIAQRLDAHL